MHEDCIYNLRLNLDVEIRSSTFCQQEGRYSRRSRLSLFGSSHFMQKAKEAIADVTRLCTF